MLTPLKSRLLKSSRPFRKSLRPSRGPPAIQFPVPQAWPPAFSTPGLLLPPTIPAWAQHFPLWLLFTLPPTLAHSSTFGAVRARRSARRGAEFAQPAERGAPAGPRDTSSTTAVGSQGRASPSSSDAFPLSSSCHLFPSLCFLIFPSK